MKKRLISEFRQTLPDHLFNFILNKTAPTFDERLRHDENGANLFVFSEAAFVNLIIISPINELEETLVKNLSLI